VPGIMRAGSMPAATSASSKEMRSSVDIEFASLFVPNGASPQFCESNHWQCLMNRSLSGERSALNGVTTGANTPQIRVLWFMAYVCNDRMGAVICNTGKGVAERTTPKKFGVHSAARSWFPASLKQSRKLESGKLNDSSLHSGICNRLNFRFRDS
jgi:hypothetical protein